MRLSSFDRPAPSRDRKAGVRSQGNSGTAGESREYKCRECFFPRSESRTLYSAKTRVVLANIVYYEFTRSKLRDLGRRFQEWTYIEELSLAKTPSVPVAAFRRSWFRGLARRTASVAPIQWTRVRINSGVSMRTRMHSPSEAPTNSRLTCLRPRGDIGDVDRRLAE